MDTATEQRFQGLEAVIRRQRLALCALCLLVAASALTSLHSPSDDTVTASRFVVVDEGGNERAVLGLQGDSRIARVEPIRLALDLIQSN